MTSSVLAIAPINRTSAQVVYGDQNWFTQVQGTTAAYLEVRGWSLAQGEPFGREEDAAAAKVCILGKTVVDKLFPDESHGLSRKGTPSRRVARMHLMRDWFVRYLGPDGGPAPVSGVATAAEPALAGTRRVGA